MLTKEGARALTQHLSHSSVTDRIPVPMTTSSFALTLFMPPSELQHLLPQNGKTAMWRTTGELSSTLLVPTQGSHTHSLRSPQAAEQPILHPVEHAVCVLRSATNTALLPRSFTITVDSLYRGSFAMSSSYLPKDTHIGIASSHQITLTNHWHLLFHHDQYFLPTTCVRVPCTVLVSIDRRDEAFSDERSILLWDALSDMTLDCSSLVILDPAASMSCTTSTAPPPSAQFNAAVYVCCSGGGATDDFPEFDLVFRMYSVTRARDPIACITPKPI
ncbi:hypothetical protein C8Q74DRAFT_170734 [Fomes fomentarius]|nr:hypothetical protein C8Q74DRAFT_170734 [Fomes fomentarius]